jgi:ABC-2 type transport system ATP-binding protein
MKAIEVKQLSKQYGSLRAVTQVSFSVESGEIFGYLGPNGSGKTTTLRCIMGLLRPTSGQCCVLDECVIPGQATQHRRIGYLPGEFHIWSGHTARQSLKVLAALGQQKDLRSRQETLAERLDLDLDRCVSTLSKGNRQKVGLIFALQHDPEILVLDEPTSGLDPLVQQVVLDLIRDAARAGASVLLSSHNLSEVAAVCKRAAILREGRLVELAPISQIIQKGEQQLEVWLSKETQVPSLPIDILPGLRILRQESRVLHLAFQGPVDPVLKWLTQFSVERISTPQTSLNEAFMQYYQKEADHDR